MRLIRYIALLLAVATLVFAATTWGSGLFGFVVAPAVVGIGLLMIAVPNARAPRIKLKTLLFAYSVVAVLSVVALTLLQPTQKGGSILLILAVIGALAALRATYLSTRKRRYGLSSYYG